MKIALLSDIHGNSIALDAVLADIEAQGGVDQYLVLGDLAAIGFDPLGTLQRIADLPNAIVVCGNTDRFIITGERPAPSLEKARNDLRLLPTLLAVSASFAWTQGAVSTNGWANWLDALPLEFRTSLPDGTRLLAVHASPGLDDGDGVHPGVSDSELESLVKDCNADLVLVGHTHWVTDRLVGNIRVVNPGSISNPFPPDLRASYAILNASESGYQVEYYRADYDREAVVRQVQRLRHPDAPYIIRFMRGENIAPWSKK